MALGGNVLRQHVVEFIRGTGIVTDGVVDATSLNGPWSWQVPEGVSQLLMDGCGAGGGGAGGQSTGTARGGGGGGGSGLSLRGLYLPVVPNSTLTIAVGAGGLGGPAAAPGAGQNGTEGGSTEILGLARSPFAGAYPSLLPDALSAFRIPSGSRGAGSGTAGNGGAGGSVAPPLGINSAGSGGNGGLSQAAPTAGAIGSEISAPGIGMFYGCAVSGIAGCGAGAGSTTPTVAGSSGQNFRGTGGRVLNASWSFRGLDTEARGTTDGSVSYGGGGGGSPSFYGMPGTVPDGNQSATPGQGFGYGGNGGGGNGAGAAGGDGYVRFTYWSMD